MCRGAWCAFAARIQITTLEVSQNARPEFGHAQRKVNRGHWTVRGQGGGGGADENMRVGNGGVARRGGIWETAFRGIIQAGYCGVVNHGIL